MTIPKKLTSITFFPLLCLALSSCGEKNKENSVESQAKATQEAITHSSVYQDLTSNLEEMSNTLSTIKDLESAKAAFPALTKLGFKIKMIKTDLEKLGPASKDITAKLEKEYRPQMNEIQSKISKTMHELETSHPEASKVISNVMRTIME